MKRIVLLVALVLALFSAAATVEATSVAHGASIHGDVVGDGGSDNSYCGSYEASYGKIVYMAGPMGYTWYQCQHFTGWTNDDFLVQPCVSGCYQNTTWHRPSTWSANWRNVDVDAWEAL